MIIRRTILYMLILGIVSCRTSSDEQTDIQEVAPGKIVPSLTSFAIPAKEYNYMSNANQEKILNVMNALANWSQEEFFEHPDKGYKSQVRTKSLEEFKGCLFATASAPWSDIAAHLYCQLNLNFRLCFTGAVKGEKAIKYTKRFSYRDAFNHCTGKVIDKTQPFGGVYKIFTKKIDDFEDVFNNLLFHTSCTYGADVQHSIISKFYQSNKYMNELVSYKSDKDIPRRDKNRYAWEGMCLNAGSATTGDSFGGVLIHPNCPVVFTIDKNNKPTQKVVRRKGVSNFEVRECFNCRCETCDFRDIVQQCVKIR